MNHQFSGDLDMKNVLKLAMVGSALAASSAFAVTVDPATGNGEFVLYARDTVTNVTFAKGLVTQINAVTGGSRAEIAADGAYSYGTSSLSYTLPPVDLSTDANWNTFKSNAGADAIVWTVLAGDSQQALNQAGAERYAITTAVDMTVGSPNPPSNSALRSVWSSLHGLQTDTLGTGAATGDGASIIQAANAGFGWGNPSGLDSTANTMFSTSGVSNENALGSAGNFYFITSTTGGSSAIGRLYKLGTLELDANGHLFVPSTVPLPAAVWLFGSGLLGLVGIGRRKQVVATA
jgi:hypothetical protein